jgi:hypothetical protein
VEVMENKALLAVEEAKLEYVSVDIVEEGSEE